jgi:hypothetical protein
MELSPTCPFGEQELGIHGLMFWRGPFGFSRLIEPIDFWRRLVMRWILTGTTRNYRVIIDLPLCR